MGEEVDIFTVEDVTDVGNGQPLLKEFDDPERRGIPEQHFEFYYGRYFSKKLVPKAFGMESLQELMNMVKDVIAPNGDEVPILVLKAADDLEVLDQFCKLTEDRRREKQRRIDAGDETVKLKFQADCMTNRVTPTVSVTPETGNQWKSGQ